MYNIIDFWRPTLCSDELPTLRRPLRTGWATHIDGLSTFVEAPLMMADGFGQKIPYDVLLVSAPGAVGKSTLAREIAAQTGAILVDLAEVRGVGAETVSGGLGWAGLLDPVCDGRVALLIDGLDEARMQVTEAGFRAFLEDIYELACQRGKPITLFGRTSATEEAWLHFAEMDFKPPILEVQFYTLEQALEFVKRRITSTRQERSQDVNATAIADAKAAGLILDRLRQETEDDGDRFAGYAPVLIAISQRVAAENNPHALVRQLERGAKGLSINDIADKILERESTKIEPLSFADPRLGGKLYRKDEQMERLISAVYGVAHMPGLPTMTDQDAETYRRALETWVPDHPFTDGSGTRPSSEVFGGFIAAEGLRKEWSADVIRTKELGSGKVNPFIWCFRLPDHWLDGDAILEEELASVQLADLGLIFASLQAGLTRSESAHLSIDADEYSDDGTRVRRQDPAEVEITRRFGRDIVRSLYLTANCRGTVYFGRRVSDVHISGLDLSVVTSGAETTLVAPVELDVDTFNAGSSPILVEGSRPGIDSAEAVVRLRCLRFEWTHTGLSIRREVTLAVDWPGSENFPWHNHRTPNVPAGFDEELAEPLQRLRRILMLFRARGQGQLAKFQGAIDHPRRTQGSGRWVRDQLLEEHVLRKEGSFYVLDRENLGEVLNLNFLDLRAAAVNQNTKEFLRRVLNAHR